MLKLPCSYVVRLFCEQAGRKVRVSAEISTKLLAYIAVLVIF